jgi:hypothetical protein
VPGGEGPVQAHFQHPDFLTLAIQILHRLVGLTVSRAWK